MADQVQEIQFANSLIQSDQTVIVKRILESVTINGTVTDSALTTVAQSIVDALAIQNSLVPYEYDAIVLGYTGTNVTSVTYKTGGTSGTTVCTLTLAYDGSDNLTSVARS